jgi:dihydrofolate reductase
MSRIRVFVGCSLDGFLAGPDDDLSWLGDPPEDGEDDHGFADFLSQIGALLMGRRTYDIVEGFGGPWPYGERPVLVATHRSLQPSGHPVEAVDGAIEDLVDRARSAAGDLDVYVDGGLMIRQALDAGLVDEIVLTIVPIVIGAGIPLFAGVNQRHSLDLVEERRLSKGLVQLTYRPAK